MVNYQENLSYYVETSEDPKFEIRKQPLTKHWGYKYCE